MAEDQAVARTDEEPARQPLIRPERYPFFDKLLFVAFVLVVPPFLASNWSVFRDGDISWHVAAGRWIMEHGGIPKTDPFSFTMPGHPWVAHEWLPEVVYALGFDLAGHAGLAAVVTLALMSVVGILFLHLRWRAGPVALLVALTSLDLVLLPFLMARPHVFAWVFLAGWTSVLIGCRERGAPPPWPLVALMWVWANTHASFVIGFVVAACIALDACIEVRWSRPVVMRWFLFGLASLVAALLNANGIPGFMHPFTISGMESLHSIGEWSPSSPRTTPLFYAILLGGLGALLVKHPRFSFGEALLLVATLGLAFTHIRHQPVFMILAVLIVTPKLAGEGRQSAGPLFSSPAEQNAWLGAAVVAGLGIAALRAAIPLTPMETFSNPRGLIAHIPPALRSEPVLNAYSMGGPLILNGVRVFIDGRADMYGDDFFTEYQKIVDGDWPSFEGAVKKYGLGWTMLQTDEPLVEKLDASPDWQRVYSDKVGVIHVRRTAPAVPAE